MAPLAPNRRPSGIPLRSELPWGSTFCLFYKTRKDLFDVLVPYLAAGLANNELCVFVCPRELREDVAAKALGKALPGYGAHAAAGRVQVVSWGRWQARGGRSGKAVLAALDKAIARGFDGLRLACGVALENAGGKGPGPAGADAVSGMNVVAAYAYPRRSLDAPALMEVVRNHRFALIGNAGRWELIESAEARTVRDELKRSEERLKSLFSNMSEGFAYHRIVLDARGRPSDYIFLQVNEAFERLTGLTAAAVVGRRATVVIPGIEKDPARWIARYGKVALTGRPARFESYAQRLGRWYMVSAFSPHKGYFAVVFNDISQRKRAEETIRYRNVTLDGINRIFREAMGSPTDEDLGRACLAVAEEVTGSRFGFIGEIDPDGALRNLAISDPGWEACAMPDKPGHLRPAGAFPIRGLYGRVILDGKGFFTNEPASHPDSIGTPEGHPRLTAFLGVPLVHGGTVVGMMAVGNRDGGYCAEDREALEALAGATVEALRHRRAEERTFETNQRLEALMRSVPVGVSFSVDPTCERITGNPAALAQFEVGADDNLSASAPDAGAPGRRVRFFREGRPISGAELPLQRAVAENRDVAPVELEVVLPSGRRWFAEASGAPLHDRQGHVVGGVAVTVDISGRKRAEEALKDSVAEKEILLKELAHRTKNNMQVIRSLLSLQASASPDGNLVGVLQDTQDRIGAMALVHEKLYRSGNFASLNMRDYVQDLVVSLLRTHQGADGPVNANMELEDIFISIDAALPCGLIINELVSNSLKHAFPGRRPGAIFLVLRKRGDGVELRYRDDGPGLPRDLDLSRIRSLGLKLVYNLAARQLRGTMEIRHEPVPEFVLEFRGAARMEGA